MFGTAYRLQSGLLPASVHSDRSSKHTCIILASIDHSRYPHFCSFGNSSTLQILTLMLTLTCIQPVLYVIWGVICLHVCLFINLSDCLSVSVSYWGITLICGCIIHSYQHSFCLNWYSYKMIFSILCARFFRSSYPGFIPHSHVLHTGIEAVHDRSRWQARKHLGRVCSNKRKLANTCCRNRWVRLNCSLNTLKVWSKCVRSVLKRQVSANRSVIEKPLSIYI